MTFFNTSEMKFNKIDTYTDFRDKFHLNSNLVTTILWWLRSQETGELVEEVEAIL